MLSKVDFIILFFGIMGIYYLIFHFQLIKKKLTTHSFWIQLLYTLIGFYIISIGISFIRQSGLGLAPWGVFHEGLSLRTGFTFGQINTWVGLIVLVIASFLSIRPSLGTALDIVVVGIFLDWNFNMVPKVDSFTIHTLYLVLGTILLGIGTGIYINGNLGAGPRDGLMLGLVQKTGKSVRLIRTIMELSVLIAGFFLGGTLGVGTILPALTIGPIVQWSLETFKMPLQKQAQISE